MIYEVEGDILLSKSPVIAHGIAAMDPMNQGLALALHEQYPAMHKDFHAWCRQSHPKAGEAWMWGGTGGVRIINLLTQEFGYGHGEKPGRASTAHVGHALRNLAKLVAKENFASLALPRIATGVGGLDWQDVQPLVQRHLGELEIPVYVYTVYRPGVQADEPSSS